MKENFKSSIESLVKDNRQEEYVKMKGHQSTDSNAFSIKTVYGLRLLR